MDILTLIREAELKGLLGGWGVKKEEELRDDYSELVQIILTIRKLLKNNVVY